MALEHSEFDSRITDDLVVGYLKSNPEFFVQNQDIFSRLKIPHETGAAISLIEKQVSVLRGRCGHLENSLRDLISVARENENLNQRLHKLIQQVISVATIEEITSLIQNSLRENFSAEDVHIMLIAAAPRRVSRKKKADGAAKPVDRTRVNRPQQVQGATVVSHNDRRVRAFTKLFAGSSTQCGMPADDQLKAILGKDHAHVASAALIPLHYQRKLGVIMLTSRDESRFAAGRGVMFLDQLGELLGRRIHSYGVLTPAGSTPAGSK